MSQTTTRSRTVAALARSRAANRAVQEVNFIGADRVIGTQYPLVGGATLEEDILLGANFLTADALGNSLISLTNGRWLCNFIAVDNTGAVEPTASVIGIIVGPTMIQAEIGFSFLGTALRIS